MITIGLFATGFGLNPAITLHYSLFNEHTSILIYKFSWTFQRHLKCWSLNLLRSRRDGTSINRILLLKMERISYLDYSASILT